MVVNPGSVAAMLSSAAASAMLAKFQPNALSPASRAVEHRFRAPGSVAPVASMMRICRKGWPMA